MLVGHVAQLWRYPVKSMRGERRGRVDVIPTYGVPGDRAWAIRDEKAGEIRGAKKIWPLVQFAARYVDEPAGSSSPPVEITFPDGTRMTTGDPGLDAGLSAALGRRVTLCSRRPAEDHEFYRRTTPVNEQELREQLDLLPGDPIPDYSAIPAEIMAELTRYVAPLGTYFDTMPLSLLTTTSMGSLAALSPGSRVDPRRFRQNVIVEGDASLDGFPETGWTGRRLRMGSLECEVVAPISRCVMVTLAQDDLPRDRDIMRTLVRETGMDFGVYLSIVRPGSVTEGDPVELE